MLPRGVCTLVLLAACVTPDASLPVAWDGAHYAAAVALLQSCGGDLTLAPALLLPGRDRYELATHQMQKCLDSANGCATLTECFGITATPDAACQPGCDGDRAIVCKPSMRITTECGRFGATCQAGACVDPAGSAPSSGAIACASTATSTCNDAETLQYCGVPVTCAKQLADSTCIGTRCMLGGACAPGKMLDGLACEGRLLRVCVAGRVVSIDCAGLGFTGCDPFTRGCSPNPLLGP